MALLGASLMLCVLGSWRYMWPQRSIRSMSPPIHSRSSAIQRWVSFCTAGSSMGRPWSMAASICAISGRHSLSISGQRSKMRLSSAALKYLP